MADLNSDLLNNSLQREIGQEHVIERPDIMIESLQPAILARPGSSEEVSACLRICSEAGAAVVPAGHRSWLESGNPINRVDVVLSLERMNRIIEYSPPDLTAVVEAGTSLSAFQENALLDRQWLPLDPAGVEESTIGAVCACGSSGSLRFGFGVPRDYVIGLRVAHTDGKVTRSGGKVVKNVAGYDMNKLYVGSWGTLAAITEVTLKLRPVPSNSVTLCINGESIGSLQALGRRVLAAAVQPVSIFVLSGIKQVGQLRLPALVLRFMDSEESIRYQISTVLKLTDRSFDSNEIVADDERLLWKALTNVDSSFAQCLKLSVPLNETANVTSTLESTGFKALTADLGTGSLRVCYDRDDNGAIELIRDLRKTARSLGGYLFVERGSVRVRREADAWGEPSDPVSLMKLIKSRFDPTNILNPGRFVAGI